MNLGFSLTGKIAYGSPPFLLKSDPKRYILICKFEHTWKKKIKISEASSFEMISTVCSLLMEEYCVRERKWWASGCLSVVVTSPVDIGIVCTTIQVYRTSMTLCLSLLFLRTTAVLKLMLRGLSQELSVFSGRK